MKCSSVKPGVTREVKESTSQNAVMRRRKSDAI
jgi:hypothetical protein